ncbi:MAG: methionyl-tRNA formyltransferase [Lachnospiraceae bacterium]|nr:methionyl-tRNA formyltransferase [Lachnospiraceae bacterium]
MRAVFMGTPEIAAVILKSVLASKHEVIAVVTQPDKPKGRGHEMAFPPVKEVALEAGIPVLQPQKARDEAFLEEMKKLNPDIILVAAYGKLLPKVLLDIPKFGCINVHASLLPKYRGASPIQWAVLNGEEKSGVTIMHMAEEMDAGDIIMTEEIMLAAEETAGSLHDRLAEIGGPLLLSAMDALENGRAPRIRQNEEEATHVKMLDKTMGNLNFAQPAVVLERWIRGLNPWPTAYTKLDGKILKLWKAEVIPAEELTKELKQEQPGTIVAMDKDSFSVKTGEGLLKVKELQLEGKRKMTAEEFLRGFKLETGTVLGR